MIDEMDELDYLQAEVDARLHRQIEQARWLPARPVSAFVCEDCGVPIPDKRRLALPGVQCCVDCQTINEAMSGRYARRGR
ncbi:TraR/DksA family transcriptional regulator [Chania multitudinisentens]|nr:TraR/DksA family transcriptional regulator [Chania multitudinisentens]